MGNVKFEFPVWVRYTMGEYHIRPLLLQGPEVSQERYEKAYKSLSKQLQKIFGKVKLDQDSLNQILWYRFNPAVKFESVLLEFRYGQRYFNGPVSVAWFAFRHFTVVLLPAFDNHFFIINQKRLRKGELIEEVTSQIQEIVRRRKKEFDEDTLLDSYLADKGEYVMTMDFHVHVPDEKVSLGEEEEDFLQSFFQQHTSFDGREEIIRVGEDLNEKYPESLSRAYYQDELVEQLRQSLYNGENVPIVLLGPRQSGKTAVIEEVVFRYLEEDPDRDLYLHDNLWMIDPTRIISGMSVIGMWQRRMESIIEFARKPIEKKNRRDILHFRNVVALFRIGKSSQNNMTLSDVLKPYMESRKLQVVLEATPEEWDVVSEQDRGFTDLCKVFRLVEPPGETALHILGRVRNLMEETHRVRIDSTVLLKLIELQRRYFSQHSIVGGSAARMEQLAVKYAGNRIDIDLVQESFEAQTHINLELAEPARKVGKDTFRWVLESGLIGQEAAVRCLINLLHILKAGLNNPERPYGSYLFIGPTGVGKTEAAKVLSSYLFTHEDRLLRFDMNEFIDEYAVSRLVGDMNNPEGQLTSKVRYNPFCVLLFDEIEKAHPEVHNLLLQVLGEGRLTDALGRTVSFTNTVIIMTSNLGAERIGREIQIQPKALLAVGTYEKAVRDFFRPEFVNRIDELVVFQHLLPADIAKIARLQIGALLKRHGFARRHTFLEISDGVLEHIAEKGFDPLMGGRALKRQIEKEMTRLLADQLVGIPGGNPIVFQLDLIQGEIVPQLIHLRHTPANESPLFPAEPEGEPVAADFEQLLANVQLLKEEMFEDSEEGLFIDFSDGGSAQLELRYELELRDELNELEQTITQILEDYRLGRHFGATASNFQIKVASRKTTKGDREYGEKSYFRDMYNRIDLEQYLEEVSLAAEVAFGTSTARYHELLMALAFLRFRFDQLEASGVDQVLVEYPNLEILAAMHMSLFPEMEWIGVGSQESSPRQHTCAYLEGPGLYELLKLEVGCHWVVTHMQGVSVARVGKVSIKKVKMDTDSRRKTEKAKYKLLEEWQPEDGSGTADTLDILRMYVAAGPEQEDMCHITDLRSGVVRKVSTRTNISASTGTHVLESEIDSLFVKSLFYANLPVSYRELIPLPTDEDA